jgi:hypothetical protein
MKRLDQGNLHSLLEHPETNMSWPGIKPVSPAPQASTLAKIYSSAYAVAILNLYMAATVHVALAHVFTGSAD